MWLMIGSFAGLVALIGGRGLVLFPSSRAALLVGIIFATAGLLAAIELCVHSCHYFALGTCIIAAGIAWEFFLEAENKGFKTLIEEIQGRQKQIKREPSG